MPDIVNVYAAEDEEAYQKLLTRLDETFPPVTGKGFDFSRIVGNSGARTAKAIVLHLSLTGWSVAQIADAIDVPVRAVSRYLAEAVREACPPEDVEVLRSFEEQKLDMQARVCWEQFARSCDDEVTETTTWEVDDEDDKGHVHTMQVPEGTPGARQVIKRVRKGQSGNPGYQRVLLEIAKHRAKLLGLEQPTKVEVDKTEKKLQVIEIVMRTREEVEQARQAGLLK